MWLGQNRGEAIRNLVQERLPGRIGEVNIHNEGPRWKGLYDAVSASDEPWRDEVLAIINEQPSEDFTLRDNRELKLRSLRGGEVWKRLLDEYLPPLRSGGLAIVTWDRSRDTVFVGSTVVYRDTVYVPAGVDGATPVVQEEAPYYISCWKPVVAVKSNLLFDAVLCPNLELEFPIGWSRWSIMAEWWTPWYRWHGNGRHNRSYELLTLGAEVRYWLSKRKDDCPRLLRGHFIGAYAASGKYDIQKGGDDDHEGWQGEYSSFGLTYGYSAFLGKHWRLELSLSGGYVGGPQRYYHGMFDDEHLIWQRNKNLRYFGPTKAKVSISYLLGWQMKKKGGRR